MSKCWGSNISLCSGKISGEHIISKSLFIGDVVRVQGFSWCKNEPKEIGLNSLTANVLCKKHNEDLSEVDTGGAFAFNVFSEMSRISNLRQNAKPKLWNVIKYTINGDLLERWFLKTLINISYGGEYPIGINSTTGKPSDKLVEIAYGQTKFANRAGLYSIVHVGQQINSTDSIGFAPVIKDKKYVDGGLFSFRGFRFLLFLNPEGPPSKLNGLYLDGKDVGNSQLNYHNIQINENTGKYLSQVVNYKWHGSTA